VQRGQWACQEMLTKSWSRNLDKNALIIQPAQHISSVTGDQNE